MTQFGRASSYSSCKNDLNATFYKVYAAADAGKDRQLSIFFFVGETIKKKKEQLEPNHTTFGFY